ncbi:Protein kinase domain-containing protein [Aphelenchoides besseyi]|nr:Protein kinase domain-containing protein [Aphelenchoides besseyi]
MFVLLLSRWFGAIRRNRSPSPEAATAADITSNRDTDEEILLLVEEVVPCSSSSRASVSKRICNSRRASQTSTSSTRSERLSTSCYNTPACSPAKEIAGTLNDKPSVFNFTTEANSNVDGEMYESFYDTQTYSDDETTILGNLPEEVKSEVNVIVDLKFTSPFCLHFAEQEIVVSGCVTERIVKNTVASLNLECYLSYSISNAKSLHKICNYILDDTSQDSCVLNTQSVPNNPQIMPPSNSRVASLTPSISSESTSEDDEDSFSSSSDESQIQRDQLNREKIKKAIEKLRAKSPSPESDSEAGTAENGNYTHVDPDDYEEGEMHIGLDEEDYPRYPLDDHNLTHSPFGSDSPVENYNDYNVEGTDGSHPAEEQEDPQDYCQGGYYPVRLGEVFNSRYHVIRKVGWGHFSTVWLCWDAISRRFVALKIVKSAENYAVSAADEIAILRVCSIPSSHPGRSRVLELLDSFKVRGVNGEHTCMVFEVLGCTLLKLIMETNYTGLPLNQVRIIIKQVLHGLSYLHDQCKIIHTDLKPENILVEMTPTQIKDMAQQMVKRIENGIKPDITEVCNMPVLPKKISKNKKKKLRKRKKKLNQTLTRQLTESYLESPSSPPNGNTNMPPPQSLLSEKIAPIPRINSKNLVGVGNGATKESEPIGNLQLNDDINDADDKAKGTHARKNKKRKNRRKRKNGENGEMSTSINEIPESQSEDLTALQRKESTKSNPAPPNESSDQESDDDLEADKFNKSLCTLLMGLPVTSIDENESQELPRVKIADLGNACWQDQHFTQDIQTRQYRALEVIIGAGYDVSADIWSVACIAFELATADYLFEPHAGADYGRDEDHLAHIMELLGMIPPEVFTRGVYWQQFFRPDGRLNRISNLKPWSLVDVLKQKYRWPDHHARPFSEFLLQLLKFDPASRPTASQILKHKWLNTPINDDPKDYYQLNEETHFHDKRGTSV